MSVAIQKVFSSAIAGRSKERQELADSNIDLEVVIPVVSLKGDEEIINNLFEPLGYTVVKESYFLDDKFVEWGKSNYYSVTLTGKKRLKDLLKHLYILIPVLDAEKHYWIGQDEVEKLLRHGDDWLKDHPHYKMIAYRYLRKQKSLINNFMQNLITNEEKDNEDTREIQFEKKVNLNTIRLEKVVEVLKNEGVKTVLDLGCGEGKLLAKIIKDKCWEKVYGGDISYNSLERAKAKLEIDFLPVEYREKIKLFQASVTYKDERFLNFDCITLIEVIEHINEERLIDLEISLFKYAMPDVLIITTPNIEYNELYGTMKKELRHKDHKFEWTRREFKDWAEKIAENYNYNYEIFDIGERDENFGSPTQMGVFRLCK